MKAKAPAHSSRPKVSRANWAVRMSRQAMVPSMASSNVEPMNPSCSPTAEKMKSVCCSGTYPPLVWVPWKRPLPYDPAGTDGELGLLRRSRSTAGWPGSGVFEFWLQEAVESRELVAVQAARSWARS